MPSLMAIILLIKVPIINKIGPTTASIPAKAIIKPNTGAGNLENQFTRLVTD